MTGPEWALVYVGLGLVWCTQAEAQTDWRPHATDPMPVRIISRMMLLAIWPVMALGRKWPTPLDEE